VRSWESTIFLRASAKVSIFPVFRAPVSKVGSC
jgi:hypothetical protein